MPRHWNGLGVKLFHVIMALPLFTTSSACSDKWINAEGDSRKKQKKRSKSS
jgi:hypothetical protein